MPEEKDKKLESELEAATKVLLKLMSAASNNLPESVQSEGRVKTLIQDINAIIKGSFPELPDKEILYLKVVISSSWSIANLMCLLEASTKS